MEYFSFIMGRCGGVGGFGLGLVVFYHVCV